MSIVRKFCRTVDCYNWHFWWIPSPSTFNTESPSLYNSHWNVLICTPYKATLLSSWLPTSDHLGHDSLISTGKPLTTDIYWILNGNTHKWFGVSCFKLNPTPPPKVARICAYKYMLFQERRVILVCLNPINIKQLRLLPSFQRTHNGTVEQVCRCGSSSSVEFIGSLQS